MILESVNRNEWVLIIDDLTDITRSAAAALSHLNQKFVLFSSVRQIRKSLEYFFWKFDRIELDSLTRYESLRLIRYLCRDAVMEDAQLFETHVLHRSGGNPRAIIEIVERAKKEPVITAGFSRNISHSGAMKKIDLSPAFILIAAACIASRFIARGTGNMDAYMFTGVGGALFMILRFFAFRSKR
jgi:integrase/recombinase XerD